MKKSDLYREWARVLDMCEGTKVDPCSAWKFNGHIQDDKMPNFEFDNPEQFEFLVAIVDNKPVFVGDKAYGVGSGNEYKATNEGWNWWCKETDEYQIYPFETPFSLSWQHPGKTFKLNGEELPCPVRSFAGRYPVTISAVSFWFSTEDDMKKVNDAIIKLLRDATK